MQVYLTNEKLVHVQCDGTVTKGAESKKEPKVVRDAVPKVKMKFVFVLKATGNAVVHSGIQMQLENAFSIGQLVMRCNHSFCNSIGQIGVDNDLSDVFNGQFDNGQSVNL